MILDLTVPLNEATPVYPGDPKPEIKPAGVLERDGYQDHAITLGTHIGTHIDAPAHMVEDGKTLDQMPIEQFVGRGVCVKVENKVFDIETIRAAGIQEGDIVLFHTGFDKSYHDPAYFEDYPQIPEDVANYLVEQKVSMVGMDMCSPDHEPFKIHKLLLSNNVLIIENLTNLDKLFGENFEVVAMPLNLQIDGAPARVIAKIQ